MASINGNNGDVIIDINIVDIINVNIISNESGEEMTKKILADNGRGVISIVVMANTINEKQWLKKI